MLPNLSEITFKVKVNTNLNEHVRIVGSIEPLGLWDPSGGLKLTTNMNDYPYWSSSEPLVLPMRTRLEFKVVIFEQNSVQRWERLPDDSNRRYKVKFAKSQLNCVEGDPVIRENVLEKLAQTISSTSITMDNKVLRKKTLGKVPFNPFSIAASDDDDEDKDSEDFSPSILDKRSPGFSSDDEEAFTFNLNVIKTSFYHSPSIIDQSFVSNSQNVDHGEKMKELYSQMRSQAHNRLWHLSSKYTFHDAFYGVNEEDLTIFEEQEMVYIVTFYLPVTINIKPDNSYEIKHNYFHESLALYEYCKKYQKNRFLWIGLHQQIPSKIKEEVQEILSTEYGCHAIYLNTDMYNKFKYECKNYLWCHLQKIDIVNKFEESKDFWTTYELVNYRIAEKILSIYDKGYVLINDYRFLLVPSLCVKQKSTLKLHYVLNFPFPSPNSFFCIPFYLQVINSVLLSWVLSFESHDDMTNFVDTVQEVYGGRLLSQSGYLTLQLYGRFIILNANAQLKREYLLSKKGSKPAIQRTLTLDRKASLHLDFEFARIVFLSVDHLSLRGGIEAKFKAIEQLLTMNPEMIGKFQLIQIFKFDYVSEDDEQRKMLKFYENQIVTINEKFSTFESNYHPIQIVTNTFQDPKWIEQYYKLAHGFIDTDMDKSYNAHLRNFIEYKEGKAVIIVNEEVADKYTDFPFTFTVNPISINDITTQLRDCFDIIVNLNEVISCNLYSGRLPLSYVEDWLLKSNMAILKANLLMRNARIFNTYVLSKSNTHDYMLAACSSNFKKPNITDIPLKYNNSVIRVFVLPLEILLTPDSLELLKIKKSADATRTAKDIDPDIYKVIESIAKSESNIVAILTKRSKVLLDNTLGGIKNLHLLAENGCFYKNTKQGVWVNISEDNFSFKEKVKQIMMNYQKRFENFRMKETESELKLVARGNFNAVPTQHLLVTLQKEIAVALGDNTRLEVVRFENSVCVRPYNINRGTTTQMLLQKTFQEKGKIGFLFCLGKTPLDEEMLAGIFRTIKMSQEIFTEVKHIFTCAIGHRPSHATYFVNTREEIKSLLKNLLVDS